MFSKVLFITLHRGRVCIFRKKNLAGLYLLCSILLVQESHEPSLKVEKLCCEVFPFFIRKNENKMLRCYLEEKRRKGKEKGEGDKERRSRIK